MFKDLIAGPNYFQNIIFFFRSYLTGQLWEQFWSGYTTYGASGETMSKDSNHQPTSGRSITELFEDVYTKMPRRPPGKNVVKTV